MESSFGGIKRQKKNDRDRVLTDSEIRTLWNADGLLMGGMVISPQVRNGRLVEHMAKRGRQLSEQEARELVRKWNAEAIHREFEKKQEKDSDPHRNPARFTCR